MVAARGRTQRPGLLRTGLVLSAAGLAGHWACGQAFAGASAHREGLRGGLAPRAATAQAEKATTGEVWLSDVSPKGKAVMKVYKELQGIKDPSKVNSLMSDLDSEQKLMLKNLLEAKSGQERPIKTTDPEVGDTVPRLFQKYKMIQEDDDAVLAWRGKMEFSMLKDVQYMIEREQMQLADAEAAQTLPDDALAEEAFQVFKGKFPVAVENGNYQGTPTRREDILFRYRRVTENMEISPEEALEIVKQDATFLVVDPYYVRRTWKKMVSCLGKEEALNDIVLKHPGALICQAQNVEAKIQQIKMGSAVIGAFASVGNLFR